MNRRRWPRSWPAALLIVGLALAIAALICEAALRDFRASDNVYATATLGIFAPDAELGWVLKPDLQRTRDWGGRAVVIRTDGHGHRIAADDAATTSSEKIPFAGDSYVFGNEVSAEETFVHLIGRAAGPGRAAVNLGVGGYQLSQECLALRRYLSEEKAIVRGFVVIYIGNDIEWGAYPSNRLRVDRWGYLGSGFASELRSMAVRNSRLAFYVFEAWRPFQSEPVDTSAYRWIYDENAFTPDRITEHGRVLAELRDDARQRGVPVTVVLMPEKDQVYGSLGDLPNRRLAAAVSDLGLPVIDLLPVLRSRAGETPPLYNEVVEGHLSPTGHQVVAEVLIHHLSYLKGRDGN